VSRPKFNVFRGIEHIQAASSRRDLRLVAAMPFGAPLSFARFGGAESLFEMTISAAAQRRHAVARDTPIRQQIGFQRTPSARSHTIRASSGSSHASQVNASSIREIAAAVGGMRAKRAGSHPKAS
jgi:hypothetical protein